MHTRRWFLSLPLLFVFVPAVMADDEEEEIDLAKVPDVVKQAAAKAVPDVKWTDAVRGKDEDGVYYTIEGENKQGRSVFVDVLPDGKVVEIDVEIPLADVPRLVTDALKAKMPRFKISTAYTVEEEGKKTGFAFDGKRPKDEDEISVFVSNDGKEIEIDE